MEYKHTLSDLYQMQSLPLEAKIRMTEYRIRQFIEEYGRDGVYVSFSGGKYSTVLLDIVRNRMNYPDIPAVFVDTGLEYPEIRQFVKSFDNVTWLRPKMTFKEVIDKYGYPFISKEVTDCVSASVAFLKKNVKEGESLLECARRIDKWDKPKRLALLMGEFEKGWGEKKKGNVEKVHEKSRFSYDKYEFLIESPFPLSPLCCNIMKKNPVHDYEKQSGRHGITGQMAEESFLRLRIWLKNGCNSFDSKNPISNPLSFWSNQDILEYIKTYNIEICSVYGDIIEDLTGTDEVEGQLTISDMVGFENMKDFDAKKLPLKTSGCTRTGCMFCGFGCHLNNDDRFVTMKETHPAQYDYIMRKKEEGGLNYKEIIDWLNENGNLHIRY